MGIKFYIQCNIGIDNRLHGYIEQVSNLTPHGERKEETRIVISCLLV